MSDKLTYKEAGVDIKEAAAIVGDIGSLVKRTEKKRQLMQSFGLFAAAYDLSGYDNPVMVTGCDGVGTKLELLLEYDMPEVAGKDLVAMSVNDILTTGADPLVFLDYIGIGKLDKDLITRLIVGMTEHLEDCGCILGGGETAEMPGLVADGVVELSGFCVGAAEKEDLIDPTTISIGDVLIGYPSDGPHANGFSLIRRVLEAYSSEFSQDDVRSLLAPTRLYHDVVGALRDAEIKPKAMAHNTGGGLPENLERLLDGKGAALEIPAWKGEAVEKLLSHVEFQEAVNTFNMGFGWVVIVSPEDADVALAAGEGSLILGEIGESSGVSVTLKG